MMHVPYLVTLILLLCLATTGLASAAGIYVDAAGGRHAWKVNEAHTLLWEEKPYLPVGMMVTAASLGAGGAWEADRAALERARAGGGADVLIRAPGAVTAAPAGALQRVVDEAERLGLRYGIALETRPTAPMDAYAIDPVQVAVPARDVAPGTAPRWSVPLPGAESAVWALVDEAEGLPILAGRAPVVNGVATIEATFRPGNRMFGPKPARLVVVPQRPMPAPGPLNLWVAFDSFQQSLVAGLKAVKWGPGLRFMVNPLPRGLGLSEDENSVIPASPEFIAGFREWLSRHYSANDLLTGWAFNERHIESLEIAARLVPLWRPRQGGKVAWFVDSAAGQIYRIDPRRSRFWADYAQFRADSARAAVSRLAEAIKAEVADIPILYEWTRYHSAYALPPGSQGADGLGLVATGRAETLITAQAGPFAAQCEEAPRDVWAVVTSWQPLATSPLDSVATPRSPEDAFQQLRSLGLKGFFLEAPGPPGAGEDPGIQTILRQARAWSADPAAPAYRPAICYYPAAAPSGATVRQLAGGVWWLPSISPGETLFLGEEIRGYHIARAFSNLAPTIEDAEVIWSAVGPQKTTFVLPKGMTVQPYDIRGQPQKLGGKSQKLSLQLDETPIVLKGVRPGMVFPVEAAMQAMTEFEALIKRAEAERMDASMVAAFQLALRDAQRIFTPTTAITVYDLIRQPLAVLREVLSPYVWLEGERPAEHNFTGVAPDPQTSDGGFLLLAATRPPEGPAYRARYPFNVTSDGLYDLWISTLAPGGLGASGLQWQMDDDPPTAAGSPPAVGKPYGPGFVWSRLGQVRLRPGRHTITLLVPAPAGETEPRHSLSLDAVVFAREPFQPDGPNRPHWNPQARR